MNFALNIPISEFSLDFLLKMPISEYLLKKTKPQVFVLDILRVGFVVGAPILEGVEDGFEGFVEVLATIPTENQVAL